MNRRELLPELKAIERSLDQVSVELEELDEEVKQLRLFCTPTFTATTAKWQNVLRGKSYDDQ